MPCKKKKYNSRFPPARIKKIMQSDDEVGKVAAVVPIIISRVLEIFVENLLKDSCKITRQRNARTLTPAHIKASILQNGQLDFLKEIVSLVPDIQTTSGDEQQLDFGHHSPNDYADFYSSSQASSTKNNSNHNNHKFTKQFSHPVTTHLPSHQHQSTSSSGENAQDSISSLSNLTAINSLNVRPPLKRFKNTYSRSNSEPCSEALDQLLQKDELSSRKRVNRMIKRQEQSSITYEEHDCIDEEDEEDESFSDEEYNDESAPSASAVQPIDRLAVMSTVGQNNAHTGLVGSKSQLEMMEDDDYDA